MSMTITDNDIGCVEVRDGVFRDELLTFGGAGTLAKGTILARDSVSLLLVPFVKGGSTNENGIPKAVLTYAVTADEAEDVAIRALVEGVVKKQRLVIHADGDDSNVDAKVLDQLRDYKITAVEVSELGRDDNPQDTVDS